MHNSHLRVPSYGSGNLLRLEEDEGLVKLANLLNSLDIDCEPALCSTALHGILVTKSWIYVCVFVSMCVWKIHGMLGEYEESMPIA